MPFYNQPRSLSLLGQIIIALTIITGSSAQAANQLATNRQLNSLNINLYLANIATPSFQLNDEKPSLPEFELGGFYNDLEPPNQNGLLGRYSVLGEDTTYFLVPAFMAMGLLYMLPESVSKWDKDEMTWDNGWDNWTDHVSHWEWDKDEAWINYIGHPYFGSAYYIHARHYGFSRLESFWFSFSMSAFYEFGIEAWAEPVSIQDLIFTPLLGWPVAELLLPMEHKINQNHGEVLNSRALGAISLFLIDPFGHIIHPLKRLSKNLFADEPTIQLSPTVQQYHQKDHTGRITKSNKNYGLRLDIIW